MSPSADSSLIGQVFNVTVGPVAHGGHCVARIGGERGRVVFVRHALPGEVVRVQVTEDGGGAFCRGDAIEILRPAPGRVEPPCAYSGPGACGGCDWQHVDGPGQRALKAAVVAEQLHHLAGLTIEVLVEELPGGLVGWRSRTRYAVDAVGRPGLRRHRSHDLELIDQCLLGAEGVGDAPELATQWPAASGVEVVTDGRARSVLVHRPTSVAGPARGRQRARVKERVERVEGPAALTHTVGGSRFMVRASGFWQGHPEAAEAFTDAVLAGLNPRPGEVAIDLYAGAGLFTVPLAVAVGPTGRVTAVEGDAGAVTDARTNCGDRVWVDVRRGAVSAATVRELGPTDVIVLDPPRTGAGREVMEAVLDSGARAVAYVACDPAAFARDVRTALDRGWHLTGLRAFDAFPMTHHVECVGVLVPAESPVF